MEGKIEERHDRHVLLVKAYGDIADAYGDRACVRRNNHLIRCYRLRTSLIISSSLTYTVLNYLEGRGLPSALMEVQILPSGTFSFQQLATAPLFRSERTWR